jgi:predicted amidophosphoribosyltransferase
MMESMIFQIRCAGCDAPGAAVCTTCRFALLGPRPQPGAHGVHAAVPFTGRARRVVLGLKYRNRRQVARHLAGLVVNAVVVNGDHRDLDLVTWAPTSSARRRSRGFDQGELVARHVARQLGVPCRRLLVRSGPTVAQTGRSRVERLNGPEFVARPGLDGRRVIVVDDVVTTGATMRAAAAALRHAGADEPRLYAIASTPAGSVTTARRQRVATGRPRAVA